MKKRKKSRRTKPEAGPPPIVNPYAMVVYTPPTERPRTRFDIVYAFCLRIEEGWLIEPAANAEGVTSQTIRNWIRDDERLFAMYARAREASAEVLEQEAIAVARSVNPLPRNFDSRLLVDTLKWAAAKRRPKVYADRIDLSVLMTQEPGQMTDAELEAAELAARQKLRLVK